MTAGSPASLARTAKILKYITAEPKSHTDTSPPTITEESAIELAKEAIDGGGMN
jgi:hypothetical protein